jgi:integrase
LFAEGKGWMKWSDSLGGPDRITPHGLRDTGNDLLRRFASREVVMAITGHSTPAMQ